MDEKGETRRERNARMGEISPPLHVPPSGLHIWAWYREIQAIASMVIDGYYRQIPPSEYVAWQQITRNLVYPWEYDILFAMDGMFCEEMNKEISSRHLMKQEQQQASKGRRG